MYIGCERNFLQFFILSWLHFRCVYTTVYQSQQDVFNSNEANFGCSKCQSADILSAKGPWQSDWDKYVVKTPKDRYGRLNDTALQKELAPLAFGPLSLGSIKAGGWLQDQFELMLNGLPGRMHEFYSHVKNTVWLGGDSEYSDRNEAWPFYINGIIPLAYGFDDNHNRAVHLRDFINRQVMHVIHHQHEDGWLGPEEQLHTRSLWARFPLFMGLAQLVEAVDDEQYSTTIVNSIHKFVRLMYKMLMDNYQGYVAKPQDRFEDHWARSRAADMVVALQWLYKKHPGNISEEIHKSMAMLYEMSFDWTYWWDEKVFYHGNLEELPSKVVDCVAPYIQGVHAAVGLKYGAAMHRLLHREEKYKFLNSTRRGVDLTFTYHGTSSGAIIADERMSGLSPFRGTELCTVVETMHSMSYLYQALGDNVFADRLELAAFNALPAMVMPRWWAHQHLSQTNQPYATELQDPTFWNIGKDGVLFGLEPVSPCCTVQMSQGYPKMLANSWLRTDENGLAHVLLVPSQVRTTLSSTVRTRNLWKKSDKVHNKIHITCKTNYPFAFMFEYNIHAERPFNFSIRIPSWVDTTSDVLYNQAYPSSFYTLNRTTHLRHLHPDSHTGLHTIQVPAGHTILEVTLSPHNPRRPTIQQRANSTIAITHGPLLYALSPHEVRHAKRPQHYPGDMAPPESNDWAISPREGDQWKLALDSSTLRFFAYDNRHDERLTEEGGPIWDAFVPPVSISALACPVAWTNQPAAAEDSGWTSDYASPNKGRKCIGRAFPVELKPYGSAKIHIAEFPTVDLSLGSKDLWDPEEERQRRSSAEKSEL